MGCITSVSPAPQDEKSSASPKVEDGHTADETGLQFREVSKIDSSNASQLMTASKNGDITAMHQLLQALGDGSVNVRGMWDSTPLIVTAQYSHYDLSLSLLKEYPDIDVRHRNEKGASALLQACINEGEGHLDVIQQILKMDPQGAYSTDPTVTGIYNPISDTTARWCPLSAVCASGNVAAFKLLYNAHALCTRDNTEKEDHGSLHFGEAVYLHVPWGSRKAAEVGRLSPLMLACAFGRADLIKVMLESYGSFMEKIMVQKDEDGCSAMHHACRGLQPSACLSILLDCDKLANEVLAEAACMKDKWGFTPLHYLCHTCGSGGVKGVQGDARQLQAASKMLSVIKASNADAAAAADAAAKFGNAATTHACDKKSLAAGMLMQYRRLSTPLHVAVARKSEVLVEWLCTACMANPLSPDGDNTTPLQLAKKAARGQETRMTKALEKAAASIEPSAGVELLALSKQSFMTPASKTSNIVEGSKQMIVTEPVLEAANVTNNNASAPQNMPTSDISTPMKAVTGNASAAALADASVPAPEVPMQASVRANSNAGSLEIQDINSPDLLLAHGDRVDTETVDDLNKVDSPRPTESAAR